MNQHFLIGPDTEEYRIFSSPDLRNSTIVGSNPTRKHKFQRKLVLHAEKLAKNHCVIKTFLESAFLKPLSSGGTTKLNGTPVKIGTAAKIRDGDVLQLGNVVYLYHIRSQPNRSRPQPQIKPVTNPERYLEELKKNPNYRATIVNCRK